MRFLCAALLLLAGVGTAAADIRINQSHYGDGTLTIAGQTEPGKTVVLDGKYKTKSNADGDFTFTEHYKPDTCMSDITLRRQRLCRRHRRLPRSPLRRRHRVDRHAAARGIADRAPAGEKGRGQDDALRRKPIPARHRAVAGRRALLVHGQERRLGHPLPQRGAVGAQGLDAVGVDRKRQPVAEASAPAIASARRRHGRRAAARSAARTRGWLPDSSNRCCRRGSPAASAAPRKPARSRARPRAWPP